MQTFFTNRAQSYDRVDGDIFAVLQGLGLPRTAVKRSGLAPYPVPPAASSQRETKSYEEPFDFTDRIEKYKAFCEFSTLLRRRDQRRTLDAPAVRSVMLELEANERASGYLTSAIQQLASNKRNFFIMASTHGRCYVSSGPVDLREDEYVYRIPGIPAPMALR